MRVLNLDDVAVGSPLGQSLYNERGDVLAAAGVTLDPPLLGAIKSRGYREVFVEDKQTEGIQIVDPLTPETRNKATKAANDTMLSGEDVHSKLGPDYFRRNSFLPKSDNLRKMVAESVPVDGIFVSANSIVEEVLDAPTQLGLNSIKAHDNFAHGHAVEVAQVAVTIGKKLGLKPPDLKRLGRGALLHDVGQVFTGDTTDGKTSSPTPSDVDQVRKHTRMGYDFLQNVPDLDALANHIAYQHHEWFNGKGYPRGLNGTPTVGRDVDAVPGQIILIAQVTAIADVYDALCSDRPFRQRLPRELAMSLIRRMAGAQLHPDLIRTFFEIVPVYPAGYPVRIVGGALDRWQGVVAKLGSPDVNRPTVRVFIRPDGSEVDPFEVDLAKDSTARLMTAPPKRRVIAQAG
jgi:HD-GYP domain-containing protein (c-di-GMP phosphodiesterase class II)